MQHELIYWNDDGEQIFCHRLFDLLQDHILTKDVQTLIVPYAKCEKPKTILGTMQRELIYWNDDGEQIFCHRLFDLLQDHILTKDVQTLIVSYAKCEKPKTIYVINNYDSVSFNTIVIDGTRTILDTITDFLTFGSINTLMMVNHKLSWYKKYVPQSKHFALHLQHFQSKIVLDIME